MWLKKEVLNKPLNRVLLKWLGIIRLPQSLPCKEEKQVILALVTGTLPLFKARASSVPLTCHSHHSYSRTHFLSRTFWDQQ